MFVNFDLDILKLLRETKALQRLELDVPAAAISVTMQESKLKVPCVCMLLRASVNLCV